MTRAFKAFNLFQISGDEGTPGSAAAATEILYATGTLPYTSQKIYYPEQDRNNLATYLANDFIVQHYLEGGIEMDANTRHMVWAFSNAIRGNITPTQPKATDEPLSYLWTWEPSLVTTPNTPDVTNGADTFTLEYGDNVQGYEAEYMVTTSLKLSGAPGEAVKCVWDFFARQVAETTVTPDLSAEAVQYFPAGDVDFFIDTTWAGLGGNAKTDSLHSWEWTYNTGFAARFASESLLFTGVSEAKKHTELKLNYYRDSATSEIEKDKFDARTTTFIRLALTGQTELDSEQDNLPYIHLDGAYCYDAWGNAGEEDGHVTEEATAYSVCDATSAKMISVKMLTDMAAYP